MSIVEPKTRLAIGKRVVAFWGREAEKSRVPAVEEDSTTGFHCHGSNYYA